MSSHFPDISTIFHVFIVTYLFVFVKIFDKCNARILANIDYYNFAVVFILILLLYIINIIYYMGANSTRNMNTPYIIKATTKQTASVSNLKRYKVNFLYIYHII